MHQSRLTLGVMVHPERSGGLHMEGIKKPADADSERYNEDKREDGQEHPCLDAPDPAHEAFPAKPEPLHWAVFFTATTEPPCLAHRVDGAGEARE